MKAARAEGAGRDRGAWLGRCFRSVGAFLAGLPRAVRVLLALSWCALIWTLSERQGASVLPSTTLFAWVGNLAHAPLFGILAVFVLAVGVEPRPGGWARPSLRRTLVLGLVVVAYGVVDELHQATTPGRISSASDVLTDLVGVASVLWVADHVVRNEPSDPGLGRRLLLALLACATAAANATWG